MMNLAETEQVFNIIIIAGEIHIKGLSEVLRLVADSQEEGGGVESTDISRKHKLVGRYRLRINAYGQQYESNIVDFGENRNQVEAEIQQREDGEWELAKIPLTFFLFNKVRLQPEGQNTSASFSEISLSQHSDEERVPIVKIIDLELDLNQSNVALENTQKAKEITTPWINIPTTKVMDGTRQGLWKKINLELDKHPDLSLNDRPSRGIHIRRDVNKNSIGIYAGGTLEDYYINYAINVAGYIVVRNCPVSLTLYSLNKDEVGALYIKAANDGINPLTIVLPRSTGIEFSSNHNGDTTLENVNELKYSNGFFVTTSFRNKRIKIAMLSGHDAESMDRISNYPICDSSQVTNNSETDSVLSDQDLGRGLLETHPSKDSTSIFGPQFRFQFALQLPSDYPVTGFDADRDNALFYYRDTSSSTGSSEISESPDPYNRFYGLRIQGLFNIMNRQEVFRTNVGVIRIFGKEDPQFHFEFGGTIIPLRGPTEVVESTVAPISKVSVIPTNGINIEMSRGLILRTKEEIVRLRRPSLVGRPMGMTSGERDPDSKLGKNNIIYDKWKMVLPRDRGDEYLNLQIIEQGLYPFDNWVNDFVTLSKSFNLLEDPGTGITLNGIDTYVSSVPSDGTQSGRTTTTSEIKIDQATGKENLVYASVFIGASLYPYREEILELGKELYDQGVSFLNTQGISIDYRFKEMSSQDLKKYIKSRNIERLNFGFWSERPGNNSGNLYLKRFIDGNIPTRDDSQNTRKLSIPFELGLSLVLFRRSETNNAEYFYDNIHRRQASQGYTLYKPGILFDFCKYAATSPTLLGWEGDWASDEWKAIVQKDPQLWPSYVARVILKSSNNSGRLDPSDEKWIGLMVRDLPIEFIINPVLDQVLKKSELARNLLSLLDNALICRYAWTNADKGWSWLVELSREAGKGYSFTPRSWKWFIDFQLLNTKLVGINGVPSLTELQVSVALNLFLDKTTEDPLEVIGYATLDLTKQNPFSSLSLRIASINNISTTAIPGFESAAIISADLDLEVVKIKLSLTPTQELTTILPIFTVDKPVDATIILDNQDSSSVTRQNKDQSIQIFIDSSKDTNLNGNLPLTILGYFIEASTSSGIKSLTIRSSINLGTILPAVGVDIVLTKNVSGLTSSDDWQVQLRFNSVSFDLDFGEKWRTSGVLAWADDTACIKEVGSSSDDYIVNNTPIPRSEIEKAKSRYVIGILKSISPLFGTLTLLLKISYEGETPYLIGTFSTSESFKIGSTRIDNPEFLIAHNADRDSSGNLKTFIQSESLNAVSNIRHLEGVPDNRKQDLERKREWISNWSYDPDIGLVMAGSGFIQLAPTVAEAPRGDLGFLSAFLASNSGLFKIQAQSEFFSTKKITYSIAVNTNEKQMTTNVRLPAVKTKEYELSPGTLSVGFSYGSKKDFSLSIGWPPLSESGGIERDWTQSIKLKVKDLYPINTFWGGIRCKYRSNDFVLGIALKAGWTYSAELKGANIAKASAELGVTIGGVAEFTIPSVRSVAPSVSTSIMPNGQLSALYTDSSSDIFIGFKDVKDYIIDEPISSSAVEAVLFDLDHTIAQMSSAVASKGNLSLYGDAWGKGSVEFLGVTLAAVDCEACLRFQGEWFYPGGVQKLVGAGSIGVSVKIGCVTYNGSASYEVVLMDS